MLHWYMIHWYNAEVPWLPSSLLLPRSKHHYLVWCVFFFGMSTGSLISSWFCDKLYPMCIILFLLSSSVTWQSFHYCMCNQVVRVISPNANKAKLWVLSRSSHCFQKREEQIRACEMSKGGEDCGSRVWRWTVWSEHVGGGGFALWCRTLLLHLWF